MSTPRPSEADVEALCALLTEWLDERPDDTPHETARRILAARDAEHEREVAALREIAASRFKDRQRVIGQRDDALARVAGWQSRAEAAERALADLRGEIEALADEWTGVRDYRTYYGDRARDLRALLPRDDAAGGGGAK